MSYPLPSGSVSVSISVQLWSIVLGIGHPTWYRSNSTECVASGRYLLLYRGVLLQFAGRWAVVWLWCRAATTATLWCDQTCGCCVGCTRPRDAAATVIRSNQHWPTDSATAAEPASKVAEVEAVVRSPTNMAAANIAAVDFNKMTSKWRHSTGLLLAAMFVGEDLLAN